MVEAPVPPAPPAAPLEPPRPPSSSEAVAQGFNALTPILAVIWILSGLSVFTVLLVKGFSLLTCVGLALASMLYVRSLFIVFGAKASPSRLPSPDWTPASWTSAAPEAGAASSG